MQMLVLTKGSKKHTGKSRKKDCCFQWNFCLILALSDHSLTISALFQSSSRRFKKTVPPRAVDLPSSSPLTTFPHSLSCVRVTEYAGSLINSQIPLKTNFLVRLIFGWATELNWLPARLHDCANTRKRVWASYRWKSSLWEAVQPQIISLFQAWNCTFTITFYCQLDVKA